jgi:glycosyltransferase involved in cell wall biosynthesis
MRVALFTDTYAPQVNGVARTLGRLADAVRSRGGEATVVTVDSPDEGVAADRDIERWPAMPFWLYPELRIAAPRMEAARRLLRQLQPDLVHVATPFGIGLAARAAARAERVPLVSSYHTSFPAYLRYYGLDALGGVAWPYLRWFHNGGRRTFAPTTIGAAELERRGFSGVRVWGRGVDRDRFSPRHRSNALRHALGVSDRDLLIVSVGRLAPEKGIDTILAAAHRLAASPYGRVRFAFVGDGPAEARYRSTAPAGTIFTGRLLGDALSEFYASADAFVFASTTDTFGNVLLEAMSSGLPVIAPDSGPTLDVADASTALLFRAGDAGALAAVTQRLAGDAALRMKLRLHSLDTAAARSWERVWDSLFAEYAEVLGARPVPVAA